MEAHDQPSKPRCRNGGVTFLLGTHQPNWLATSRVPLFISDRRLRRYRIFPRAATPWALDSGAFAELATHGDWSHGPTPQQYIERVRRYRREIGKLLWAAPQDWMCEPHIIARTGLSVTEHQRRTVANFCTLRRLAPDLPFIPVAQGWTVADYIRCIALYREAGIDVQSERLVGVGSVCRRQGSEEVGTILRALHAAGVTRLHGFGVKLLGLRRHGHLLVSADSLAWSFSARRSPPLPECAARHRTCANCPVFACRWRNYLIRRVGHARNAARLNKELKQKEVFLQPRAKETPHKTPPRSPHIYHNCIGRTTWNDNPKEVSTSTCGWYRQLKNPVTKR